MDFFTSQDHARKKTGRLVLLFVISVILMMVILHLIVATALVAANAKFDAEMGGISPYANPIVIISVAVCTLLIVGLGSAYKMVALSGGGKTVAESLGGRLLSPNTTDLNERKLLNVVEEMAIAAGVAVPPVYLLENEKGINAFAAGYSVDDAVIGITTGCMVLLSRDELQGVIAHEFSHILNGDMRLNIRLIGILHGILIIGMLGYFVLRFMPYTTGSHRRSRSKDGGGGVLIAILIIAFGMIIVGFIGTLFGNIIKAAVSRQREYLADASAVQYTRNPEGIGNALQKIGGYSKKSTITHPNAPQASHLFFGEGITSGISSAFATHPPLHDRIKRVLPNWNGKFPKVRSLTQNEKGSDTSATTSKKLSSEERKKAMMQAMVGVSMLEMIGKPTPAHVAYAANLISTIPDAAKNAAREVYGARAIVFALLLDRNDKKIRAKQMDGLESLSELGLFEETVKLLPIVDTLDNKLRLPLIDLTLPALRSMSSSQYNAFIQSVKLLVEADNKIDLFEWALQRILLRHLAVQFGKNASPSHVKYYGLQRLAPECSTLLSVLAHAGAARTGKSPEGISQDVSAAFTLAAAHLKIPNIILHKRNDISLQDLDTALTKLNLVKPALKQQVIEAAALCAAADRQVTEDEAELLRAFADGLGVPMPPLLPGQPLVGLKR